MYTHTCKYGNIGNACARCSTHVDLSYADCKPADCTYFEHRLIMHVSSTYRRAKSVYSDRDCVASQDERLENIQGTDEIWGKRKEGMKEEGKKGRKTEKRTRC